MVSKEVIVSVALRKTSIRVGRLCFHIKKGKEAASFEYDKQWLVHPEKFALEPLLQLTEGTFHTGADMSLFGAMGDSTPDHWGRVLMRRAQAAKVKNDNSPSGTLFEVDYLLGVNDEARQGALRFSVEPLDTLYSKQRDKDPIPPLIYLPKLLSATERFMEDNESDQDLKMLLAPGSSLGGTRPKASIIDKDGLLAIAKFPKKDDDFSIILWEAVALTLAKSAGINVPLWRLETVFDKPVLIIKRFDRRHDERIPFLSAMSMLGARDNESRSYLEIAYALTQYGANPQSDMTELWRRIVFSIMISNTDDHLRNHGFFYEHVGGWRLSPAYDLNPVPLEVKPRILTTAIDFNDTTASLEVAMGVAKDFRLSHEQARQIVEEVSAAVRQWRQVASRMGISKPECDRMASAFEIADTYQPV